MKKTTKKVEEKRHGFHMVLAEVNMGSRKAEIFDAVLGAFVFIFMISSALIVVVSMFVSGFTWAKLGSLVLDLFFAWLWYHLARD